MGEVQDVFDKLTLSEVREAKDNYYGGKYSCFAEFASNYKYEDVAKMVILYDAKTNARKLKH